VKLVETHKTWTKHFYEHNTIKENIRKTDAEIDEIIYKIYAITADERKVIENFLK
jgi:hypothetical protein